MSCAAQRSDCAAFAIWPAGAAHDQSACHRGGTYQKALDGRKWPIRGLGQRNGKFNARISVEDPGTGRKQVQRHPLPATVAESPRASRAWLWN